MVTPARAGLVLALLAPGCRGVARIDDADGTQDGTPPVVRDVLVANCSCHMGGMTQGGISFDAGIPEELIVWGDPAASVFIQVTLRGAETPMPPGGYETMRDADRAILIGWVLGLPFEEGTTGLPATTTDETMTGSDTGTDLIACSLEAIDATVASPIEAGEGAGQIPTDIGDALERNCGCHYVESAGSPYLAWPEGQPLRTLADFTGPYAGTNQAYAEGPGWAAVQDRVITQQTMPMSLCETEEGTAITDADFALFEAWFEQEAPDGATFEPPA